ncbi:MAG: type II CAAX endopeptidase family protein [Candidatus Omnitrophica bacterium]|nr:type II CAAX endopeptidase family protein [Candidatus Omnitrophota bacterium]MDD5311034.1 type II CAAX endopeptidase family protein [Candidatus Omnitrophota bacterium]MDD5546542.1 type II CAAX endopeptidase family protein [Candidatus Omnitrophota bacterium]
MSWDKLRRFAGGNRIYLLMLSFIIATEIFLAVSPSPDRKERLAEKKKTHKILTPKEVLAQEERIRELLAGDKLLGFAVTASTFLSAAALLAGLVLGIRGIARKLNGRDLMVAYGSPPDVPWQLTDILRVIITFYFFSYALQWVEANMFDLMKVDNPNEVFFGVLNATLIDIIGLAIVAHFAVNKFKSGFAGLGLVFKNIKRNMRVAIGGYLVIVPVLAVIMIIVFIGLRIFSYEPPETKALEILYEAKGTKLLLVLTALVTVIGPIAEELFFRGFAYPVFRKKIGVRNAILLISFVFAMLHMNIVSFFPIFALGILLAYLYEKTGSVVPSIAVHIIHNSAVIFFVFLYKLIAIPN